MGLKALDGVMDVSFDVAELVFAVCSVASGGGEKTVTQMSCRCVDVTARRRSIATNSNHESKMTGIENRHTCSMRNQAVRVRITCATVWILGTLE